MLSMPDIPSFVASLSQTTGSHRWPPTRITWEALTSPGAQEAPRLIKGETLR